MPSHYVADQLDKTFIFSSNGRITEIQTSAGGVVENVRKFTYVHNNLTSFEDGKGTVYHYKYENTSNPFVRRPLMFPEQLAQVPVFKRGHYLYKLVLT